MILNFSRDASIWISAPPKVTDVKIIGDLRENSKVTATGIVTGGTEGSSRVQWFKICSSTLDENSLEALSTSKIAKVWSLKFFQNCKGRLLFLWFLSVPKDSWNTRHNIFRIQFWFLVGFWRGQAFRIPLGAVGCYIVAKFTPMTPDGDSGEPAFVISDTTVESRFICPSSLLLGSGSVIKYQEYKCHTFHKLNSLECHLYFSWN